MRRIRKQDGRSASQIRRKVRIKRQAYAELSHLVSLESVAKKIKLPFIQRAQGNVIDSNAIKPPDPAATLPGSGLDSIPRNGDATVLPVSRPESHNVLLVVDQRLSMYYGSKQKMKSVVAAEAAALIAWRAFAQKDRVGAITFTDQETALLSPHCSRVQIMLILHDILNQNHRLSSSADQRSNPGMLNHALRRTAATASGSFQVVLITDGSGQDQETARLLQNISARNDLAVILVYDPRQTECSDGYCSRSNNRSISRPGLKDSCLFAEGILTIPLNTLLDTTDQFRRGFKKLLRLSRKRITKQFGTPLSNCIQPRQPANAPERVENGDSIAVSPMPSALGTSQSICAQLNSR
jgi:hypothetical protein